MSKSSVNFYELSGGVSRPRSAARAARRDSSCAVVVGCAPPSTRRAIRSVSSRVVAASRTLLASRVACAEINLCHLCVGCPGSVERHAIEQVSRRWRGCLRGDSGRTRRKFDSTQGVTIASLTSNASRRGVGQWGGAGGACCEDHLALAWAIWGFRGGFCFFVVASVLQDASSLCLHSLSSSRAAA